MELTQAALSVIANYLKNPVVMDFVRNEALEQTAADIRAKCNGGTTAKAVELLMARRQDVRDRFNQYVAAGLVGCYLAAQN